MKGSPASLASCGRANSAPSNDSGHVSAEPYSLPSVSSTKVLDIFYLKYSNFWSMLRRPAPRLLISIMFLEIFCSNIAKSRQTHLHSKLRKCPLPRPLHWTLTQLRTSLLKMSYFTPLSLPRWGFEWKGVHRFYSEMISNT